MMQLHALPGRALDRTLRTWRLPLDVTQTILRRDTDPATSAPTRAFERFEVAARSLVGNAFHDTRLIDRAELQRRKLDELEHSLELQQEAKARKQEADKTRQQREQAAEERRRSADADAAKREQALEAERARAEAQLEAETAERQAAEEDRAEQRREATELRDAAGTKRALDAKSQALAKKEQAAAAAERALHLDDEGARRAAARKARRKSA
jgi:hypothetical protein